MRDYKYIIFDVDGTLLNYELSERGAFYRTAAICGFDADEDTYQMYIDICDRVWEKYDLVRGRQGVGLPEVIPPCVPSAVDQHDVRIVLVSEFMEFHLYASC